MKASSYLSCFMIAILLFFPFETKAEQWGRNRIGGFYLFSGMGFMDDDSQQRIIAESNPARDAHSRVKSQGISSLAQRKVKYGSTDQYFSITNPRNKVSLYNYLDASSDGKKDSLAYGINHAEFTGLIFGYNELSSLLDDAVGSPDQYGTGQNIKRAVKEVKAKIGYNLAENFRALVLRNTYRQQYRSDDDALQNYRIHETGISMESRIMPKTWAFLRYMYGRQIYDVNPDTIVGATNSDFTRQRGGIGLSWDDGAKFTGEVSIGYEWLNYDNPYTAAGIRRDNDNSWTTATELTYNPTSNTAVGLSINRTIRNSAADTAQKFEDTSLSVKVSQKIMPKATLNAGASYGKNVYNDGLTKNVEGSRTDNNYQGNIGVDYVVREWLDVGIGYAYNRKDSTLVSKDYTDNQFMATVKIEY